MDIIRTDKAPAAIGPYSQAVHHGGFVFTSGQLGADPPTGVLADGVRAQSERAIRNLAAVLEAAGTGLERVVKTTCYLADMGDFTVFNEVYEAHFPGRPARSCIEAAALPKGALVEIEAVAAR